MGKRGIVAPIERYSGGEYGKPGFFGAQTVVGNAFPDVDENALNDLAVGLMALGDRIDGEVIPHHAHQRMELSDWQGEASRLAQAAASDLLGAYGDACSTVYRAADKVYRAEAAVVRTKHAVNTTADITETICKIFDEASKRMLAASDLARQAGDISGANAFANSATTFSALIPKIIASALAENQKLVSACAVSLAADLGVPPGTPGADGEMPPMRPPSAPVPTGTGTGTAPTSSAPGSSSGPGGGTVGTATADKPAPAEPVVSNAGSGPGGGTVGTATADKPAPARPEVNNAGSGPGGGSAGTAKADKDRKSVV